MMVVKSNIREYAVEETDSLAHAVRRALTSEHRVHAIVDAALVSAGYEQDLTPLSRSGAVFLEATEHQKTFEQLTPVFLQLLELGFRRTTSILAIGGGVIQDIACFVASVLMRGVEWNFIPTTLLAQCDSCIGSKSSINVGSFKNQIGTFYPPSRVYLSGAVLRTLPHDEIRSGLGEAIKLHLLSSEEDFARLRAQLDVKELTEIDLLPIIRRSLEIKRRYIEADEFDRGIRNLLNYGHTFGHAYESASAYAIPHGIAVTLGIATATYVSEQLKLLPDGYFASLAEFLDRYHTPYEQNLASLQRASVIAAMKRDKKNLGAEVTCILTRGCGKMEKRSLQVELLDALLAKFIETIQ